MRHLHCFGGAKAPKGNAVKHFLAALDGNPTRKRGMNRDSTCRPVRPSLTRRVTICLKTPCIALENASQRCPKGRQPRGRSNMSKANVASPWVKNNQAIGRAVREPSDRRQPRPKWCGPPFRPRCAALRGNAIWLGRFYRNRRKGLRNFVASPWAKLAPPRLGRSGLVCRFVEIFAVNTFRTDLGGTAKQKCAQTKQDLMAGDTIESPQPPDHARTYVCHLEKHFENSIQQSQTGETNSWLQAVPRAVFPRATIAAFSGA